MIKGVLGYDKSSERYVIYGDFGEEKDLHCGDYFEVEVGLGSACAWVGTTIEMRGDSNEWYLTAKGLSLANMAGLPARYDND